MKMVAEVQEGNVQGTITHVLDEQLALGVRSKGGLGRVLLRYVGNRTTAVGRSYCRRRSYLQRPQSKTAPTWPLDIFQEYYRSIRNLK